MELFDILNEDGTRSGLVRERGVAHRDGSLHETVHTWIVRKAAGEDRRWEVLLQKRSAIKDSNPGCYDISSAGHLSSGDIPLEGALRELKEELGLTAEREDFHYVGKHRGSYQAPFHGRLFRDNELSNVYVLTKHFDERELSLQESEVESVLWMDYETCRRRIHEGTLPNCIYEDEFDMVGDYLKTIT
jgi:8-oxo-dGTP diphosphatase